MKCAFGKLTLFYTCSTRCVFKPGQASKRTSLPPPLLKGCDPRHADHIPHWERGLLFWFCCYFYICWDFTMWEWCKSGASNGSPAMEWAVLAREQSQQSAKRWRERPGATASVSRSTYAWSNFLFTCINISLFVLKFVGVVVMFLSSEIVFTNIGIVLVEFLGVRARDLWMLDSWLPPFRDPLQRVEEVDGYMKKRRKKVESILSWLSNQLLLRGSSEGESHRWMVP